MKNLNTKYLMALVATLGVFALPLLAGAQFDPTRGVNATNLSAAPVYDILITIMKFGLVLLTILGVIGFIISGLIFITAGGAGKAATAQNWLMYSILGIIVGLIGYIVIRLIDGILKNNVTGVN